MYELLDKEVKKRFDDLKDYREAKKKGKLKTGLYFWRIPNNIILLDWDGVNKKEKSLILTDKQFELICEKLKKKEV